MTYLLVIGGVTTTFLKTVCQIGLPFAAHVNLNLVQTLAHAARLPSPHLIQWELLRARHPSFLLQVVMVVVLGVH